MRTRENVDSIYRKKLGKVSTPPPAAAWQNISARLPEKKGAKRILPLWYKLAGAAAVLGLVVVLSRSSFSPNEMVSTSSTTTKTINITGIIEGSSTSFREKMLGASLLLDALKQNRMNLERLEALEARTDQSATARTSFESLAAGFERLEMSGRILDGKFNSIDPGPEALLAVHDDGDENQALPEEALLSFTPEPGNLETDVREPRVKITTRVAPVYFDAGTGNLFNGQFTQNRGKREISTSYGLQVAYAVSKKLNLRTGINKLDLSYTTADVPVTAAANSSPRDTGPSVMSTTTPATAEVHQQMGYLEIPMEMEYALLNKKLGVSLIAGASTFILDQNQVSLNAAAFTTSLGEAENLNDLSFSTNLGVGINYNISRQFQLSMEPTLKYQFNTFRRKSDNHPYHVGLFYGFSYRF